MLNSGVRRNAPEQKKISIFSGGRMHFSVQWVYSSGGSENTQFTKGMILRQ